MILGLLLLPYALKFNYSKQVMIMIIIILGNLIIIIKKAQGKEMWYETSKSVFTLPGGHEDLAASWRGSTSDDSHSPSFPRGGSEISYGDAVRRTPWWWGCSWWVFLLFKPCIILKQIKWVHPPINVSKINNHHL